jgi:outer membrane protein OmpA-like peptidoglycan-associated protein
MNNPTRHKEHDSEGMVISILRVALAAGALGFLVSAHGLATAFADDCGKAREVYAQGVAQVNLGERKQAFQTATELCPSYAEAHVNLADAHEHLQDLPSAEKHYQKAIDLGLDSPVPHIGLGEVYLKTGRFELAVEAFQKALEVDGEQPTAKTDLQVAFQSISREKRLFTAEEIKGCLTESEGFHVMCMCPSEQYAFLKKWICLPVFFFREGSAALSLEAEKQLAELAAALNSGELISRTWRIVGHADSNGSDSYNKDLARRRAESVRRALVVKNRVEGSRIKVESFGSKRPRASNAIPEDRARNRRVEIVLD